MNPAVPSLRTVATAAGIDIGAAISVPALTKDASYRDVCGREFSMITAENAMKLPQLLPAEGRFDFSGADAVVDFAHANGMKVRGHTLVWHFSYPEWMNGRTWSRESLSRFLHDYISTVAGRYKGRIAAWDVVNEAIADDGSLRKSLWLETLGPGYLAQAFAWSHEADPGARLFYNEYGIEFGGPKTEALFSLIRELRDSGAPVHGVGLQMHIPLSPAPDIARLESVIAGLRALGLEVHITELDVRIEGEPTPGTLEAQARVYADILSCGLRNRAVSAMVMWGFTDKYSWIPAFFKDHGHALIFDSNFRPKPAYWALQQVLDDFRRHK